MREITFGNGLLRSSVGSWLIVVVLVFVGHVERSCGVDAGAGNPSALAAHSHSAQNAITAYGTLETPRHTATARTASKKPRNEFEYQFDALPI